MDSAVQAHHLLNKYFWDMSDDVSLNTGKEGALPEDAADFIAEYIELFGMNMTAFVFRHYSPDEGLFFLPTMLLPAYLRTDHHEPEPLTVKMLIDAAQAGRWPSA